VQQGKRTKPVNLQWRLEAVLGKKLSVGAESHSMQSRKRGDRLVRSDVDCDGQINPVDSGIVQSLFGTCEEPREVCP